MTVPLVALALDVILLALSADRFVPGTAVTARTMGEGLAFPGCYVAYDLLLFSQVL